MPTIQILFDDSVVKQSEVLELGSALREICLGAKNLQNVTFAFAYGENPKIKVGLAPLEVYVKITRPKIINEQKLAGELRDKLSAWKKQANFNHPINILLMPMDWLVEDSI